MTQRQLCRRLVGIVALLVCGQASADTKLNNGDVLSDTPMWIVTYIEVATDSIAEATALIKQHTARSKGVTGNLRIEALQRMGRHNHFAVLEAWQDPEARSRHATSDDTITFRNALQPFLYAPYDERPHVGLQAVNPGKIPAGNDTTIYVLTHADIVPPEQFAPCNRQVDPKGPCGNDLLINLAKNSRKQAGNLRFDVLTQADRSNHMTVVEMWADDAAQTTHQQHAAKKQFRDELAGIEPGSGVNPDAEFVPDMMTGSLWDERLFRLLSD